MKYSFLLLFFLFACSGGSKSGGSSAPAVNPPPVITDPGPEPIQAETILLNYDNKDKYTKNNSYTISLQSDKNFSLAKVYRGNSCTESSLISGYNRSSISSGISVSLLPNQNNIFSVKVLDVNNLESIECEEFANIYHDTINPITLGMSDYLLAANKNVSQISFYAGGDIEDDHPEGFVIAKIVYYKLVNSARVTVGEFSTEDYNNKNIRLILSENETNFFYFSAIDQAGNESEQAGLLIVDHQNSSPSAPLLTQELINIKNRYTDQTSINLKGIVGVSTQRVRVYSDSTKTQLLADTLASVFETSGISVNLSLNSFNDFFIVAVKNSNESPLTEFSINQKTTPPNKPVVDPYIMQAHNLVEDEELLKYIAFFGTLDPDVVKVNIYSDNARTDLLISYNADDWIAGTGPIYLMSEGLNTLYFVSVDDVGRESVDSVFLQVTFDTVE